MAGLTIINLMLHERLSQSLDDAAVDLSAHDHPVEHAPEVVNHEIAVDHHLAGVRIHFQLAHMGAVGMARRGWAEAAARFKPDAEFVRERTHGRVSRLGHIEDADRLVGADDAQLPILEFHVGGVRLHQRGAHLPRFLDQGIARSLEGIAADDGAARAVGAAADRHASGIALHVADHFERHVEPVMHHLRKHGGVALPVRVGAAEDRQGAVWIEAQIR